MTTLRAPEIRTVSLKEIKPYENNPRNIPSRAMEAVKGSIERYGYQQPIVVDQDLVIIVGHTRYAALTEMGVKNVEVYVADLPEDKVREYRLIDNRTSEMGEWDHSALIVELREFEQGLLETYFPEVDLEISTLREESVTTSDVERATKKVLTVKESPILLVTKIECPACFHVFDVRTDSLPGLTRVDLKDLGEQEG
jgi:hypothetical protein